MTKPKPSPSRIKPTTHAGRAARQAPVPRPRGLSTRWVAVVLAVLVLLFFRDVMLGGMTFVAPDATQPAGFVRMGEKSLYEQHVYPLWNPYVFLGMPSFGSGAYNPLIYPPDWPLALIQKIVPLPDQTWLVLYYFLGALFLYLLALEWGASREGALLGGAAFVLAPNLVAVGSHGHGSQLVDSAYIPLLLWLAARWMRRGGLHHLGWLALAGGFQMLRGHVQITFYTWLAIALYLIVDLVVALVQPRSADAGTIPIATRLARMAGIGGAMVLAFGLAGFYNLPLRDYAKHSIRGGGAGGGVGIDYATAWSMGPWELPSLVVPGAVGFGGGSYWGGMPFTDYPNAYVGMVAAVLLLPAFLGNGAARLFALVLALFALLISFGKFFPLYGFLYSHLPLFNKFRVPVMSIVLFQVAAALGVAWGWTGVLEAARAPDARRRLVGRLMLVAAAMLALVLVVGVLNQQAWHAAYVKSAVAHRTAVAPTSGYTPEAADFAYQRFVGDLGRACLLGLLAAGLVVLTRRGRVPALLATGAALVLILVELWPVSTAVMAPVIGPRVANPLEQGRDEVVDFLEKQGRPESYRLLPLIEFQTNRLAGFGITSLGGYHAAKPRLFQDLMDTKAFLTLPWMRLLNVRYVLVDQPLDSPGLVPVLKGENSLLYRNDHALPRVTVVGAYRVAPAKAIIDSIKSGVHDPATLTWLERDPELRLGPVAGARATISRYGLNQVVVDVETPGPGLLRLADMWYPDWVATVDGKPVEILRADYLLRAVPVPAGRHRVEFRYRSKAVREGLMLSLTSLAIVLGLLAAGIRRRPRPEPAAALREAA